MHGVEVGLDFGDLAADVRIDALDFNAGHVGGAQVDVLHVRDGDAELVVLEARGNVGVRLRINVGIAADRDGCAHAELGRNAVDPLEFGLALDVEAADARLEREGDLAGGLADAGVDDLLGAEAGAKRAGDFAAAHGVDAGAEAREHLKNAGRRVGLHGIADGMRDVGERLFVGEVVALDASAGIDVGGLLESAGEFEQGDAFAEEDAVLPVKAGPVVVFRHLEGKVQGRFVC